MIPSSIARMRDLGDEQIQTGTTSCSCWTTSTSTLARCPRQELDQLRRYRPRILPKPSAIAHAMGRLQGRQTALDDFGRHPRFDQRHAAADTLNKFISRCNGMGSESGVCLRFQAGAIGRIGGQH